MRSQSEARATGFLLPQPHAPQIRPCAPLRPPSAQAIEHAFKNETIGLVTREQFVEKRLTIEDRLKAEQKRLRHEAEEEALRVGWGGGTNRPCLAWLSSVWGSSSGAAVQGVHPNPRSVCGLGSFVAGNLGWVLTRCPAVGGRPCRRWSGSGP